MQFCTHLIEQSGDILLWNFTTFWFWRFTSQLRLFQYVCCWVNSVKYIAECSIGRECIGRCKDAVTVLVTSLLICCSLNICISNSHCDSVWIEQTAGLKLPHYLHPLGEQKMWPAAVSHISLSKGSTEPQGKVTNFLTFSPLAHNHAVVIHKATASFLGCVIWEWGQKHRVSWDSSTIRRL